MIRILPLKICGKCTKSIKATAAHHYANLFEIKYITTCRGESYDTLQSFAIKQNQIYRVCGFQFFILRLCNSKQCINKNLELLKDSSFHPFKFLI